MMNWKMQFSILLGVVVVYGGLMACQYDPDQRAEGTAGQQEAQQEGEKSPDLPEHPPEPLRGNIIRR